MKQIIYLFLFYFLTILSFEDHYRNAKEHKKNIAVIGTGYVGLVLGACLADFNHNVTCADIDEKKIDSLRNSIIPIYEPGLDILVSRNIKTGNLSFSTNIGEAIKNNEIIFVAVNTPMAEDGKANIDAVKSVAKTIGKNLNEYKLICMKSTVPVGTSNLVKQIIGENCSNNITFDIVNNSEFLREGSAILDFIKPDRVVIGAENERAFALMEEVYFPFIERNVPFVLTDLLSAETIKYASNSFLAVKISFINEMAKLCDITGANIDAVAKGMGLDHRIGPEFLKPGPGFGGSCFPKDTQALLYTAASNGLDLKVIRAAIDVNEEQVNYIFKKILKFFDGNLKNKNITILGLSFKPNTDDVRYSPAITIMEKLKTFGANIKAYDPIAMDNMKREIHDIEYCANEYDALENSDCAVILTEWQEFKELDWNKIKKLMKNHFVVDARNIVDIKILNDLNFKYSNIGNSRKINFT
ncbi:UDP-glucose/GDP-mannose dehydrogenase family protein [Candidatus Dependentiae bacterium]|nr:UDP-glucose/GDP-mannose dehydrogenase family protein [Candidatus Dependentiae bacterium]